MTGIISKCLDQIKKVFNVYLGVLAVLALNTAIKAMNYVFRFDQSNLEIMKFEVHSEYFSFVYGLLFGVLVFILWLQIRQLREAVVFSINDQTTKQNDLQRVMRFHPWLASPFRDSRWGPSLFWGFLFVGLIRLISLVIAHILGGHTTANPLMFKLIGFFDSIVFVAGFYFLVISRRDVSAIRADLRLG